MSIRFGIPLRLVHTSQLLVTRQVYKPQHATFFSSSSRRSSSYQNPVLRYLSRLKWVPIPLGVGFAFIGYQQFGHVQERERRRIQACQNPEDLLVKDWVVTLYKLLPLKAMSCTAGKIANKELPMWLREPLFKFYIWMFNCNINEAAISDLKHYQTLSQFFRRQLKPDARPIDREYGVVCPSDGKILYFGKAENGQVEQVKGIRYPLQGFLGPQDWQQLEQFRLHQLECEKTGSDNQVDSSHMAMKPQVYQDKLKHNPANEIYQCVIYLAPGDYHRYHVPTEWAVNFRRHFQGEIFSVSPGIARLVKGLFCFNERVTYYGDWKHGFFSMTAVGATNVGSINIYFDKSLECNSCHRLEPGQYLDRVFSMSNSKITGQEFKRGDNFGDFNFGSTIVLVFEAPKDFAFCVEPGQKVKMGEPLGCSEHSKNNEYIDSVSS